MHEKSESNDLEWPQLEAMKDHTEQITVPVAVKDAIQQGMWLGRKRKKRRMRLRVIYSTMCLLVLISAASVRFSPVVAAYVSDIPGLRSLVQLINYDKGLQLALDNNFMQEVGISEEHDGIKLTVDGILADESRIIVIYTLHNLDGHKEIMNLQNVKILNDIEASLSYGSSEFNKEWESKQGTIDLNLHEGAEIPDTLELELNLGNDRMTAADSTLWHFVIPVDKDKFTGLKETYNLNETVIVEGQSITFEKMIVYPTRIGLEIAYDPSNTKKIFYFDDLRLEDEYGETFGTITNGISGTNIDENRELLYFQSNYFKQPNQLYLRGSSIRALDKSKLEVMVDLDRKELLTKPDDRLTWDVSAVSREANLGVLAFQLQNDDPLDENRTYNLFTNRYKDASGQSFDSNQSGATTHEYYYYIKKMNYQSPLTLTIEDYPARIHGNIDIKIK